MKSSEKKTSARNSNSCSRKASTQYSKTIGYLNNSEKREIDAMIRTSKRVATEKK